MYIYTALQDEIQLGWVNINEQPTLYSYYRSEYTKLHPAASQDAHALIAAVVRPTVSKVSCICTLICAHVCARVCCVYVRYPVYACMHCILSITLYSLIVYC